MGELYTEGHLGGYVVGGDPATTFPDLWRWLVNELGVKSVFDVGCGDGVALRYFRNLGCEVAGIDGVTQHDPAIRRWDYTDGPWPANIEGHHFDLVWSCEFVEHVEEPFVPNFLRTFRLAPLVLMTHADVGQAGYHHVNCQPASYWLGAMAAIGYQLDGELTHNARAEAAKNTDPWNHFARSGMAFRRP